MKKTIFFLIGILLFLSSCDDVVPSLHPVVQEKNAIVLDDLEGHWYELYSDTENSGVTSRFDGKGQSIQLDSLSIANSEENNEHNSLPEMTFEVIRAVNLSWENNSLESQPTPGSESIVNSYFLRLSGTEVSDNPHLTKVMLTRIQDQYYLDFEPVKGENFADNILFANNFIAGHSFAKLEIVESGMIRLKTFDSSYISRLIKEHRIRLKHELISVLDEDQIIITASTREIRAFIKKYGEDDQLYKDELTFVKYREL